MADFQEYVHHAARKDLSHSELFEDKLDDKEKDFVQNLSTKKQTDISSKELQKLKEISRKHVPIDIRGKLWLMLSGGYKVKNDTPDLYQEIHNELFCQGDFIPDGMKENREFLTYYLTERGGHKLREVLCVINHLNPDVTYCPLMEPVVSILLHFLDEADCFAVITGLLENKSISFLAQTKFDNIKADATLQDLLKSVNNKAFLRIKSFLDVKERKGEKLVLFPTWRKIIFERLDFVCLVRIIDCLMVEGSKILYRIGLYLLNVFHGYSLSFKKLECASPHELIATIGQYAASIQLKYLMKDAMKISITTKQMDKFNAENGKLYKLKKLDYQEDVSVNQIVAIDLHQVSDIIKPMQWQNLCQWLPLRIQIKQPYLLFSSEEHGYNLKTMYGLCEAEEQTLLILRTTENEIFGAYLSASLSERHDGRRNLSYFGTGETFIFKLIPETICYHWNQPSKGVEESEAVVRNKYVFVDTTPLDSHNTTEKPPSKSRRKSLKRSLTMGAKIPRHDVEDGSGAKKALALLNIRRNAASVPRHLFLGESIPITDIPAKKKAPLRSAATFDVSYSKQLRKDHFMSETIREEDEEDIKKTKSKPRSQSENVPRPSLQKSKAVLGESFELLEEECAPKISATQPMFIIGENGDVKPTELFISCDNNKFIVGGGDGEALWLDGEMANGRSRQCTTFNNSPLTKNEKGDFIVARLDVFGFQ